MASSASVGLYLIVEAIAGPSQIERVRAALAAAPIASVLVTGSKGRPLDAGSAGPLVELVQDQGIAVLIDGDARLARTLRADGVHLRPTTEMPEAVEDARSLLGARAILGGDAGGTRHGAMTLGESGADYVSFSGPDREALLEWWAEIFEVPCVAIDTATPEAAAQAAAAGADFVAVPLAADTSPGDVQASVQSYARAVAPAGQVLA